MKIKLNHRHLVREVLWRKRSSSRHCFSQDNCHANRNFSDNDHVLGNVNGNVNGNANGNANGNGSGNGNDVLTFFYELIDNLLIKIIFLAINWKTMKNHNCETCDFEMLTMKCQKKLL